MPPIVIMVAAGNRVFVRGHQCIANPSIQHVNRLAGRLPGSLTRF